MLCYKINVCLISVVGIIKCVGWIKIGYVDGYNVVGVDSNVVVFVK